MIRNIFKSNLDLALLGQIFQLKEGEYQESRGPRGAGVNKTLVSSWR